MTRSTRDPDAITSYKGLRCSQSERSAMLAFDRAEARYARERDAKRQAKGPLALRLCKALVWLIVAVVLFSARGVTLALTAVTAVLLFTVRTKGNDPCSTN